MNKRKMKSLRRIMAIVLSLSILFSSFSYSPRVEAAEALGFALSMEALGEIEYAMYEGLRLKSTLLGKTSFGEGIDYDLLDDYTTFEFNRWSLADNAQRALLRLEYPSYDIVQDGREYRVFYHPTSFVIRDLATGEVFEYVPYDTPGKLKHAADYLTESYKNYQKMAGLYYANGVSTYYTMLKSIGVVPRWLDYAVTAFFASVIQSGQTRYYTSSLTSGYDALASIGSTFVADASWMYGYNRSGTITYTKYDIRFPVLLQGSEHFSFAVYGPYRDTIQFYDYSYQDGSCAELPVEVHETEIIEFPGGGSSQNDKGDRRISLIPYQGSSDDSPNFIRGEEHFNLPLFDDLASALRSIQNQDFSDLSNGVRVNSAQLNTLALSDYLDNTLRYAPIAITNIADQLSWGLTDVATDNTAPEITPDYELAANEILQNMPPRSYPEGSPSMNPVVDPDADSYPDPDSSAGGAPEGWGILNKILAEIRAIARNVWSFFKDPIETIKNAVTGIKTNIQDIIELLRSILEAISTRFKSIDFNFKDTLSTLIEPAILIILIIVLLLRIFVHCLVLIAKIYAIGADTSLLNEHVLMGINHIKDIRLPLMGNISLWDLFMSMLTIAVFLSVIQALRRYANKLRR